jgi:hypothetical protein
MSLHFSTIIFFSLLGEVYRIQNIIIYDISSVFWANGPNAILPLTQYLLTSNVFL